MRALMLLLALAGCDRVFGLGDPYEDAPAALSDGVMRDGAGSGSGDTRPATELARFRFDGTLLDDISRSLAQCLSSAGFCSYAVSRTGTGESLSLDGQTCIEFSLPATPTALTLAMWVDPTDGVSRTLIDRPAASGNSWFEQEDNDSLLFSANPSGTTMSASAAGGPVAGAWHSVVITVSPQETRFYLDGIDEGAGVGIALTYTASTLYIGCSAQATATNNYKGLLDDLVIFDGVVNSTQLSQLF